MDPKQQPPYPLRMTPELRARLESDAVQSRRSLNAEITERLERSLSGQGADDPNIRTLTTALARAEQSSALAAWESQRRLLAGARVSVAFMRLKAELERGGTSVDGVIDDLPEVLDRVNIFFDEMAESQKSGRTDELIALAEKRRDEMAAAVEQMSRAILTRMEAAGTSQEEMAALQAETESMRAAVERDRKKPKPPLFGAVPARKRKPKA